MALSQGEVGSIVVMAIMVAVIIAQVSLFFFAILDQSVTLLYAGLLLLFCILLWFHCTFRHMCTLLTLLAYVAIVPSAFYLYFTLGLTDSEARMRPMRP